MRRVLKVTGIEQFESKAVYQVILDCSQNHTRVIEQSVERTQAGIDALSESKLRAANFRASHNELLDEIPKGVLEIRAAMHDARLD
jgi:hypothetical protein